MWKAWTRAAGFAAACRRGGRSAASSTPAAEVIEPGVIEHIDGTRFTLGEPDGSPPERAERGRQAFVTGGLKAPVRGDIRDESG